MTEGHEPIADDEILYRRIPASASPQRYDPTTKELNDQAFAPHQKQDLTGISVSRAKYKSVKDAAVGRPGKSYYVAVLHAGDLKQVGITVEPRPIKDQGIDDPGHAELPELNSSNYKESQTLELQRKLVELTREVLGPFGN